jgi:hypothetical protein
VRRYRSSCGALKFMHILVRVALQQLAQVDQVI